MKKGIRKRYCKFCGGAIDVKTKQCETCGKQYFHFRVLMKCLLAAVQCLLVIALVSIIVVQHVQYNAEISSLTKKTEDLDMQTIRNNTEIRNLQNKLSDSEARLEFFDKYVVFLPLGESPFMDENEYHKQNCTHFKKHLLFASPAEFSAMDVKMAEYLGYKHCPDCLG
jgi:hypothetical protein